ncbi:MAG: hypothetical protein R3B70_35685 [Polyangiaceae bacterium]
MVAAQIFNAERGRPSEPVYGAVTTGSNWSFLRLDGSHVQVDLTEYYLSDLEKIVAILVAMTTQAGAGEPPSA